jgi:hypothetical protein
VPANKVAVCSHVGPIEQRPKQRPHLSYPPQQWLSEPTLTKRTEAREAPSPVVPANTVAGRSHADRANTGENSAIQCRARHHRECLSPRRPSEQKTGQRPQQSCSPPLWLAKGTEVREAPSSVMPANNLAGCAHADLANRSQSISLACRAFHCSSCLSPRRVAD